MNWTTSLRRWVFCLLLTRRQFASFDRRYIWRALSSQCGFWSFVNVGAYTCCETMTLSLHRLSLSDIRDIHEFFCILFGKVFLLANASWHISMAPATENEKLANERGPRNTHIFFFFSMCLTNSHIESTIYDSVSKTSRKLIVSILSVVSGGLWTKYNLVIERLIWGYFAVSHASVLIF